MRRVCIGLVVALVGCEFPRPADVLGSGDSGTGDDGGGGSDGGGGDGGGGVGFAVVSTLPAPRSFHSFGFDSSHLSLFGGIDDGSGLPLSIEQATLGPNNTLSSFTRSPNQLRTGGTGIGVTVIGLGMFAPGGELAPSGNTSTEIQLGSLNADGSLAGFSSTPQTLASSRTTEGLVNTGKFVYVFGGVRIQPGSTTQLASVERASITGTLLSTFSSVSGVNLVAPNTQFASVVVANFLYVLGGTSGGTTLDTVQRATINPDGTLTTFTSTGGHLVTPRLSHAAVVLNGAVYVIGGRGTGDGFDSVERATINPDFSLGPFTTVANLRLAFARYGHSAHVFGKSIFVVGGQRDVVTVLDSVERATVP